MTIDEIYRTVQALANKEQRGYITPREFNLYMKNAQMKFTKTVKKLKTHLSFWKKKAVAAGVSPDLKP